MSEFPPRPEENNDMFNLDIPHTWANDSTEAYVVDPGHAAAALRAERGDMKASSYTQMLRKRYKQSATYESFNKMMGRIWGSIYAEKGSLTPDEQNELRRTIMSESLCDGFAVGLAACDHLLSTKYDRVASPRIDDLAATIKKIIEMLMNTSGPSGFPQILEGFGARYYEQGLAYPTYISQERAAAINATPDPLCAFADELCDQLYPSGNYVGALGGYNEQTRDIANFRQGFTLVRFAYVAHRMGIDRRFEEAFAAADEVR